MLRRNFIKIYLPVMKPDAADEDDTASLLRMGSIADEALFYSDTSIWQSVLYEAPFTFGATDGTSEDPEREGKQHGQEDEERHEWVAHLR